MYVCLFVCVFVCVYACVCWWPHSGFYIEFKIAAGGPGGGVSCKCAHPGQAESYKSGKVASFEIFSWIRRAP